MARCGSGRPTSHGGPCTGEPASGSPARSSDSSCSPNSRSGITSWSRRNRPTRALAAAKAAIDQGLDTDLDTGLKIEQHLFAGLFATKDRTIGLESFLANGPGKAKFVGE